MTDTPQLLLVHHLKTLKLPTFLREYDKLARQGAAEGADPVRDELELIDRERRMVVRSWRAVNMSSAARTSSRSATAAPARPISLSALVWQPARRGSRWASPRPPPWFTS